MRRIVRAAIISDIHGNREALDVVLDKIEELECERIYCLGDIVGYGAEPGYCVDRVRESCSEVVAGNHDHAVLGKINVECFNPHAQQATLWTREQLSEEQLLYLDRLPLVRSLESCTIVHGSLDSPELFDYIQSSYHAYLTLKCLGNKVCFVGHSHVPIAFLLDEVITYTLDTRIELREVMKAIVNVGSVGQPRDGNPLSSFAIYDDENESAEIHRIPYDIEGSASRILAAGLPEFLAERLIVGR
ncbi:MAG: metallophosphoesterase family protein [Planctomycetota bacterium]